LDGLKAWYFVMSQEKKVPPADPSHCFRAAESNPTNRVSIRGEYLDILFGRCPVSATINVASFIIVHGDVVDEK